MGKAQVSLEYLIIIGIVLGLLIPAVFFFYSYSSSGISNSVSEQINDIGLRSIGAVKTTYAYGKNAKQTIEFSMPEEVLEVYADGYELVFVYNTPSGVSHAVFFSDIHMSSTIMPNKNISLAVHPGLTTYQFLSTGSTINISEFT